jgi:hypothetical protein
MEVLGFGTILLIVAVVIWFGLLRPVESAARMLDKEVMVLEDQQTLRHNEWYIDNLVDAEKVAAADASRAYYNKLRQVK